MTQTELVEQIMAQTRKNTVEARLGNGAMRNLLPMNRKHSSIANNKCVPNVEERELQHVGVGNIMATPPKGFSRRLHRKQAAEFLGVSLSWLDKARISGLGPVFVTMGGRVLYDSRDLEAFIDSNRHSSTSEEY